MLVVEGVNEAVAAQIAALNTVHRLDLKLGPGEIVRATVDLYSSTMRIFLTAASLDDIDHDCRRIEELKDGVYRLRHEEGG